MDENVVIVVASLTKAIASAAIGILVDDGLMNWTDIGSANSKAPARAGP